MIERTYRISDVVSEEFIRFPMTLLANPKYRALSLEAKFIYALLLNRLTLSQKNNWINEDNEVYLIYTREDAATALNISYKKAIAAFRELIEAALLLEHRQGRGYPNLLYVLKAELNDSDAVEFSESFDREDAAENEPESESGGQICQNGSSRHAEIAHQDMPNRQFKTCQIGISRPAETAVQDMQKSHPRKIENNYIENSEIEISQSIHPDSENSEVTDGQAEYHTLRHILAKCELDLFDEAVEKMFEAVIERLFYSSQVKLGTAVLPQQTVRKYLMQLDHDILEAALGKLRENEKTVVNPTAYLMSVILNGVCEQESRLILDIPPTYQRYEGGGEEDVYHSISGTFTGDAASVQDDSG